LTVLLTGALTGCFLTAALGLAGAAAGFFTAGLAAFFTVTFLGAVAFLTVAISISSFLITG
ncbi:MAG: hypothetical protein V4718_17215, partial [Pseudomonadota bacterium]